MNDCYFEYIGKTFVIVFDKDRTYFYRVVDDKRQELSTDERREIDILLNSKYGYEYYSEVLFNLIDKNEKIDNKHMVSSSLDWIESIMPEESKGKLYKKLENLEVEFDTQNIDNLKGSEEDGRIRGVYRPDQNKLTMNKAYTKFVKDASLKKEDPDAVFWSYMNQGLAHELLHVASSDYNKETGVQLTGYDKYPAIKDDDRNRGLTEGYTEIMSWACVPEVDTRASGYYTEACLAAQVAQLAGFDTMNDAYFNNKGIAPIKEKLNGIINKPDDINILFRKMEYNYLIGDLNKQRSLVGDVQNILLDFLDKKVENMVENGKVDAISTYVNYYGSAMVSSESLNDRNNNKQQYPQIDESINKFNSIKEKYSMYIEGDKALK